MKKLLTFLMMSILTIGVGWAEEVTDVLTRATTGVTGNNYSDWSGKTSNSDAVYAGNSAGGNESIQLRSNNNNSGIVTTASGGKVKSITIAFNSETADGRTVNIYGKNSAYSTSADLYASSSQGTLLGTIVKGTSTSLTVDGDYAFIGLRSASSALYISSITIIWETSGGTTLEKVETPTFSVPAGSYDEAQIVEISCATTGATIYFSTDNETFKNYNEAITISETTTLHAYASKEGMDNSQTASATYIIVDNSPAQPGEEVMFDYRTGKEFAQSNGDDMEQSSKKGITIDFGGGSNTSNTPKWYSSNNGNARVYVNNTITVNAGELAIESVSFTFEGTNSLSNPSVQPGSYDNGVWSVGATSGVLTADKTARIATITVKLAEEGTVVNPPTISGSEIFEGSTEITITAQDGATIYYTVDGSEPTTSSTLYSAPFTINATTTVKAIAYVGEVASSIATKTFVKYDISSVAEFNALEQGTNFKYTGNNLVAIAQTSNGANLYVQDGEKGMLIYKSGGIGKTYVLGDKIPSGFTGTRSTYNGAPEMTNPAGFADSEDNVEVSPLEITPSQVGDNFGRYTIIKNATFNTSAKTITANGETIDYYTTFLNGSPTDGVAYNVIGVCTYYTKNNAYLPEFLPISFTEVETTGPDYYLIGSFNDWAQKDENYKFTALANGSYSFNGTIPDDVLFKVLKVDGENITWLGGSAGDYFGITKDVCTDIPLVDGANFKMEVGGICTFTVSSDQKLSVSKESQLFLVGTMNDWEKTSALEAANDGWTITMPLEIDDEFKFVDEWGTWYGGGNTIAEANLGAQITLNNGGNFVMAVDGNFVFIVATDKSSFKITRKAETTEAMFNFNDDYATLFPFLNGVTLPYDIEDPITATVDGISVTISPKTSGSTANRIYNNDPKLRVYTGTITVTAPEGYNLTGIEFTNHSTNFNLTPSDGDLSGSGETHTWTGATATLVLTVGGNTQIGTMNVTIAKINVNTPATPVIEGESPFVGSTQVTITCDTEGASIYYTTNGNDPTTESTLYEAPFTINEAVTVKARAYSAGGVASQIATKEFEKTPSIENLTAFYNYEGTDEFAFTGNLVAIAQTGNYLYAQDDAKGVLIYGTIDKTYAKGDKIPAGFHAKKGAYHGAPQMTNATGLQKDTEQTTVQPVELTIAQASQDNQENLYRYAVIKEVKYEDGKIFSGTDELTIFDQRFTTEITPVNGKTYNVTGIVGWHDGAQFMPMEYELVQLPVALEGVTFTEGRQWATWCGAEPLVLPTNVYAYVVKGVQDDAVTVESVDYIPADLGVLLYSTTPAANLTAEVYTDEIEDEPESELKGTLDDMTVSEDVYVLYNNKFILAQNGTTVGAHRCYLPASVLEETGTQSGAPVLRIALPGTVTGIEDLRYDSNGKPVGYYDLTGRYVGTSLIGKRGIFITSDGKKVVK